MHTYLGSSLWNRGPLLARGIVTCLMVIVPPTSGSIPKHKNKTSSGKLSSSLMLSYNTWRREEIDFTAIMPLKLYEINFDVVPRIETNIDSSVTIILNSDATRQRVSAAESNKNN